VAAYGALTGTATAPGGGTAPPPAPRCEGTDLVVDPAGDGASPVGGLPAPAQDFRSLSFAASPSTLTVTAKYVDLSNLPAPGTTFTNHLVAWTAPNGVVYGVSTVLPGGGYRVGRYDAATGGLATGSTSTVPGSMVQGPAARSPGRCR
jgi:hypothetical protein